MKHLALLFILCLIPDVTNAADLSNKCGNDMQTFFPYKAGIEAEKNEMYTEAFIIFCNLALKGDYRAQFKLANYYYSGIPELIEIDYEFAYIWSKLSNHYTTSKRKTLFTEKILQKIAVKNRQTLHLKYEVALNIIPAGTKIDQKYEPINYSKIIKEYKKRKEKKQFVGSRIRRDEPILSTRIFDY